MITVDITVDAVTDDTGWAAFTSIPDMIYRADRFSLLDDPIDIGRVLIDPPAAIAVTRTVQAFLARRDGKPVGRIVAIHDRAFTEYTGESMGFFGFYEAIDDQLVADGLLDAAQAWIIEQGLATMSGPFNPSMFYSAGILVGNGAPTRPLIGMPHNPDYYAGQLETWGLAGIKDFYSYEFDDPYILFTSPEFARHREIFAKVQARSAVTFRSMKYRTLRRDARIILDLYNATFVDFWGFSPLSYAELFEILKTMLPILDRKLTLLAELDGKPVGFLMAIPDANLAADRVAKFKSRWMRDLGTLWHVKGLSRGKVVDSARVDMLFVDPACTDKAVAPLLIMELSQRLKDKGYRRVEAAPVLDDSAWMKGSFLTRIDKSPRRIYRIYTRTVFSASN